MTSIHELDLVEREGLAHFEVRLLHEFGATDGYLTPEKISELWQLARKFDVLFSDYTVGKIEPFLHILLNPRSVWLEILRNDEPVGVAYISHVNPKFDAKGHFAFWDSKAGGRAPVIWGIMEWMFQRYDLRRISAEVPPYQSGVIRFIKALGFVQEGERRDAVIYRDRWYPLIEFGILRYEFESAYSEFFIADTEGENV